MEGTHRRSGAQSDAPPARRFFSVLSPLAPLGAHLLPGSNERCTAFGAPTVGACAFMKCLSHCLLLCRWNAKFPSLSLAYRLSAAFRDTQPLFCLEQEAMTEWRTSRQTNTFRPAFPSVALGRSQTRSPANRCRWTQTAQGLRTRHSPQWALFAHRSHPSSHLSPAPLLLSRPLQSVHSMPVDSCMQPAVDPPSFAACSARSDVEQ